MSDSISQAWRHCRPGLSGKFSNFDRAAHPLSPSLQAAPPFWTYPYPLEGVLAMSPAGRHARADDANAMGGLHFRICIFDIRLSFSGFANRQYLCRLL